MLMRLADGFPDAVAKLTIQYRMHGDICRLSNTIGKQDASFTRLLFCILCVYPNNVLIVAGDFLKLIKVFSNVAAREFNTESYVLLTFLPTLAF